MGLWDYLGDCLFDFVNRLTPKVCLENIEYFFKKVDSVLLNMPTSRSSILSLADVKQWRNLVVIALVGGWLLKLSKSHGVMDEKNPVYNMFKDAFHKIGVSELWPLVIDCINKCNYLIEQEKDVNAQIAVAAWLSSNAQRFCRNSKVEQIDIEFTASFLCDVDRDDYKISDFEPKISMSKKKIENDAKNHQSYKDFLRMLEEAKKKGN